MNREGTYCQAPRLKRGWELWLGDGWVTITSVRVRGEHVLIGAADGRTYRAGYLDAVRCRQVGSRLAVTAAWCRIKQPLPRGRRGASVPSR